MSNFINNQSKSDKNIFSDKEVISDKDNSKCDAITVTDNNQENASKIQNKKFCTIKCENIVSSEVFESVDNKGDKHYHHVLHEISFLIHESEIFAVSSKDELEIITLLKIIGNITPYYSGTCIINGIGSKRKKKVIHEGIYYIDTHTMLYDNMTVMEYLYFAISPQSKLKENELKKMLLDLLVDIGLSYISLSYILYLTPQEKIVIELITALFSKSKLIISELTQYEFPVLLCQCVAKLCTYYKKHKKTLVIGSMQSSLLGITCDRILILMESKPMFIGTLDQLYHKADNVLYVIHDNNLELVKNQIEAKMPIYNCKIVDDMLIVKKYDGMKRDDALFYRSLALYGIYPESVKINKGRVQNSFEELLNIYDVD